jgi:Xaa-Pro dipeptidase
LREGGGLYANLTRFVEFFEPDVEIQRRVELCGAILRKVNEATRPGSTLGEIFDRCRELYAEAGFPEEWKLHHQGGMTGYASREVVARPDLDVPVEVNQAYAWNPSVTGAKAEGTILITEQGYEDLA